MMVPVLLPPFTVLRQLPCLAGSIRSSHSNFSGLSFGLKLHFAICRPYNVAAPGPPPGGSGSPGRPERLVRGIMGRLHPHPAEGPGKDGPPSAVSYPRDPLGTPPAAPPPPQPL